MGLHAGPTRVRDPEGTKRAVLVAAERLFAERGFAGTSLRDIATASGVSHPLIQHHFGTKENLYGAVLRLYCEDYAARFPDLGFSDQPVDLRRELGQIFLFLRENEPLLRIIGWARLEGRQELLSGGEDLERAMIRRIAVGQRLGHVRGDIDAATLSVMMQGLLFYWVENRSHLAQRFEEKPDDDAYLEKVVALLERGFAPGVAKGPPGGRRQGRSTGDSPRPSPG